LIPLEQEQYNTIKPTSQTVYDHVCMLYVNFNQTQNKHNIYRISGRAENQTTV